MSFKLRRAVFSGLLLVVGLFVFTLTIYRHDVGWWLKLRMYSSSAPGVANTPPPKCPGCNLILVSLDTLRADRLGFLGSPLGLTPHLDKIAASSVNFRRAYTNAFFTTPSHMTIFTGLYPTTHRVEATEVKVARLPRTTAPRVPLAQKFKTMAEILREAKYATIWSAPLEFKFLDFRDGFGRGFEKLLPPMFTRALNFPLDEPIELKSSLLANVTSSKKPFFLFAHSYITHLPYVRFDGAAETFQVPYSIRGLLERVPRILRAAPDTLLQKVKLEDIDFGKAAAACQDFQDMDLCFSKYTSPDGFVHRLGHFQLRAAGEILQKDAPPAELQAYIEAYDEGVRRLDQQVGAFWEYLEKNKLLENSVVVFLSDHGEELFDHGEGNHSSFYEHTARVPLLIHVPGAKPEVRDDLVSLVDVLPTVLGILEVTVPNSVQGKSVFGRAKGADYEFGFSLGIRYVRDRDWKFVQGEQGNTELYFLPLDPHEKKNLIGSRYPEVRRKIAEFESALAEWKLEQAL